MKLSIWQRLEGGSMVNYVRLGLDPSSTLKAQACLGLDNFGLVPPLVYTIHQLQVTKTPQKSREAIPGGQFGAVFVT